MSIDSAFNLLILQNSSIYSQCYKSDSKYPVNASINLILCKSLNNMNLNINYIQFIDNMYLFIDLSYFHYHLDYRCVIYQTLHQNKIVRIRIQIQSKYTVNSLPLANYLVDKTTFTVSSGAGGSEEYTCRHGHHGRGKKETVMERVDRQKKEEHMKIIQVSLHVLCKVMHIQETYGFSNRMHV